MIAREAQYHENAFCDVKSAEKSNDEKFNSTNPSSNYQHVIFDYYHEYTPVEGILHEGDHVDISNHFYDEEGSDFRFNKYRGWPGLSGKNSSPVQRNKDKDEEDEKDGKENNNFFESELKRDYISSEHYEIWKQNSDSTSNVNIGHNYSHKYTNHYLSGSAHIKSLESKLFHDRFRDFLLPNEDSELNQFRTRIAITTLYAKYLKILKYSSDPLIERHVNISELESDDFWLHKLPLVSFLCSACLYITLLIHLEKSFMISVFMVTIFFLLFVIAGILIEKDATLSHEIITKNRYLQEQLIVLYPNLKKVNISLRYLFSLLLEVQLVAKGYQVLLPVNAGICSNLDWNQYDPINDSVDKSIPIGSSEDVRIIILKSISRLNKYIELCIDSISQNIGLGKELGDLEKESYGGYFYFDSPTALNSISNHTTETIPTHSLSVKFLKTKHFEFQNNVKTLSEILIRLFQQSQDVYAFPNQIVNTSFEQLLKSPLMQLNSEFEAVIQDLENCMQKFVGFSNEELQKSSSKKIQHAPVQVLMQNYYLQNINSSLSDLRARLNLFHQLGTRLRDNKATYDECLQCFNTIRIECIDSFKKTFESVGTMLLKSSKHYNECETSNDSLEKSITTYNEEPIAEQFISNIDSDDEMEETFFTTSEGSSKRSMEQVDNIKDVIREKTIVYRFESKDDEETKLETPSVVFQLPKLNELKDSLRKRIVSSVQVDEETISEEEDSSKCISNNIQPKKVESILQTFSQSIGDPSTTKMQVMTEMKNVLEKRSREYQYHYIGVS